MRRKASDSRLCAFPEDDPVKRDEIAGRPLDALRQYQRPRQKKFKLADAKRLFEMMRGKAESKPLRRSSKRATDFHYRSLC
jgi:hypothetical protein